jgi:hypothetical protein
MLSVNQCLALNIVWRVPIDKAAMVADGDQLMSLDQGDDQVFSSSTCFWRSQSGSPFQA